MARIEESIGMMRILIKNNREIIGNVILRDEWNEFNFSLEKSTLTSPNKRKIVIYILLIEFRNLLLLKRFDEILVRIPNFLSSLVTSIRIF